MDDAYAKANHIKQLHDAFSTQASDLERNLVFLGEQRERLADFLDQLTSEQAEFQTKILQLDQEIDAIARNDRLLEMLESRQHRLDSLSNRYSAPDIGTLTANLQDKRAEQEARFEMLTRGGDRDNYDERAKYLLDRGIGAADEKTETIEISPTVIEIGPDGDDDGRVASRD
jgi:DNA repair ATPase RecN